MLSVDTNNRGEQTQRSRPAAIDQGTGFHLGGQHFSLGGERLHRPCQRRIRQAELQLLGKQVPVGEHGSAPSRSGRFGTCHNVAEASAQSGPLPVKRELSLGARSREVLTERSIA